MYSHLVRLHTLMLLYLGGPPHETCGRLYAALSERVKDGVLRAPYFYIWTLIWLSSFTTGSEYCGWLHCGWLHCGCHQSMYSHPVRVHTLMRGRNRITCGYDPLGHEIRFWIRLKFKLLCEKDPRVPRCCSVCSKDPQMSTPHTHTKPLTPHLTPHTQDLTP